MIDQIVEAIRDIKIVIPEITVNVPKPGVAVEVKVPKQEVPTVNVTAPATKIDFPTPVPNPWRNGAVCAVTKRNSWGFIEEFTIKPIKPL